LKDALPLAHDRPYLQGNVNSAKPAKVTLNKGEIPVPSFNTPTAAMSADLIGFLQQPRPVLITTLDAETSWPTNNLISWLVAADESTIRFASDHDGRLIENVRADHRVLVTVMAGDSCHAIEGEAKVLKDEMEGLELALGCIEVQVRGVRDVMFYGGKLVSEPKFDVTYDQSLKMTLDTSVFNALRTK